MLLSVIEAHLYIWKWWFKPVIPAFRRLRQEGHEFKVSLGCIARAYLKKNKKHLICLKAVQSLMSTSNPA
jgi:hypothetical protein